MIAVAYLGTRGRFSYFSRTCWAGGDKCAKFRVETKEVLGGG